MSTPVPVNIITGAFGAGKTTAIAKLLAHKPAHENWVVILNEFTDTGIDTLTLASAAKGAYDVRMIPGGCLCCTGEEDFRRQLANLLAQPLAQRPARILIEPSGIAHAGAIVDELRGFARGGALELRSVVCLLDAQRTDDFTALTGVAREQIEAADVLLLSKAEFADGAARQRFVSWSEQLFPAKRYAGFCEQGMLPEIALDPPDRRFSLDAFVIERITSADVSLAAPVEFKTKSVVATQTTRTVQIAHSTVQARNYYWLERDACGWLVPSDVIFDADRVEQALRSSPLMSKAERVKAVLRTGIDRASLFQRWETRCSVSDSAWRQDSRIEVQLEAQVSSDWAQWDQLWRSLAE